MCWLSMINGTKHETDIEYCVLNQVLPVQAGSNVTRSIKMDVLRVRMEELLQTIPDLSSSSSDPVLSFEAWLGIIDDDGPSIEDETCPPSDAFFSSFVGLINWAYHTPINPMETADDFQKLESIHVTKWLRFCMDLKIGEGFVFKLLACDGTQTFLDALFYHINCLSQLQSAQNTYVQSVRKSMGMLRLDHISKIRDTTDLLQIEMDEHLQRLECIVGEVYSAGSVPIRALCRQHLATYWHSFVMHGCCGGGMIHENTLALGIAMTLRVLLRVLKGSTKHEKVHEHLLMHSLLPLHHPNSLVLWRDQTAMLELYHEPLVQCMAVLFHKQPSWISPVLDALLKPPIWAPSNTPKCILLLHEVDLILKILPDECQVPAWHTLHTQLMLCMASDNSRLSERSLQFFRNDRFNHLFYLHIEESLPSFLRSTVTPTQLPWNPTVRKMLYNVLKTVHDKDGEAFAKACRFAFESVRAGASHQAAARDKFLPTISSSQPGSDASNKRAPSKAPDFSLKAGMGDWRPPKRNHSGMPPPSPHGGRHSMISSSKVSISGGKEPPLTVTGVAPWANKSPSQPPLTVTGIAPWTVHSNVVHVSHVDSTSSTLDETAEANSPRRSNAALETVLKFMEDIRPPAEDEGASPWSKMQMEESPTLFPSLKFHDLVFGHELGSGAFGVVKYARRIDKSKTRSHWAEYAVKIVSTQKIVEMGYEASVRREIAILRIMSHPGIARLISSFRFKDGAYLVLEYASRGDLHMLLRKNGSLDHESSRFVMGEVLAALYSIHELGFIYGDLKTENTLITETGHIKLTDFGASRPYTEAAKDLIRKDAIKALEELRDGDWKTTKRDVSLENDVDVVGWSGVSDDDKAARDVDQSMEDDFLIEGTIAYLPPEVVLGAFPTPASDMWALGCVLYQCLTGRPPLLDDNEELTRQKIVSFDHQSSGQHDPLFGEDHAKDVEEDAKALIRKLLTRDSRQRLTTGQAADDAFFRGKNVFTLYREAAHPLDVGTVAPDIDAKWGRRQLSSIWAPQPQAYDVSATAVNEPGIETSADCSTPIPEGDERTAFFTFTKRSGLMNEVRE